MKKWFLLFSLFCGIENLYAQHITGCLTDESGIPIEYANVILLTAKDSTFITGCITDTEGRFKLDNTAHKGNLLKLSYIGFDDLYHPVPEGMSNTGNLMLKAKTTILGDVTVTASKPLFRQTNGTMITDVAGSVLSHAHEMTEIISQIPGMVKTANGGLEVFGLGNPVIYINNRKMQDQMELQQLTPKEIKSIELITNPGARYDAEGKAVLKIITLNKEDGWTLQIGNKVKQNDLSSYSGNLKIGFRYQKLSLSAGYDYDNSKNKSILPQSKELFIGEHTHRYDQDQKAKGHQTNHDWQINADYEINDKHNIGLGWNASDNKDKEHRISTLDYLLNGKSVQHTNILNNYQNRTKYNHINIFHNGEWNKHLSTEFNLDYVNNQNTYHQETNETTNDHPLQTVSNGKSILDIYAGKLTFDYKLNDKTGLSWGIEYNHTKGNGSLNSDSENIPTSNYNNIENKYAIYAEANVSIGNATINGGIRYEGLTFDYKNHIDPTGNVHRHYKNIYPSLSFTHHKNGWANTLSFSSRTSRPTFRQLSNSSYYTNEFMYQCGNPLLEPSTSYIVQWNTGYKIINFSTSYTYVKNYISTDFYTPENNPSQIVSSYINYNKIQYLKANLNLQKNMAWWKPSLSLGMIQPFFKYTYRNEEVSSNKPQLYAIINQYFQLPQSYLLSVYYYYNNGGNQGAVTLKPYQMLNMGVQKTFLADKLSISLQAQDVFHTMKFKEVEKIKNIHFRQTEDYCLWNYSISIIYRLNQAKPKYRGKASVNEEIERL